MTRQAVTILTVVLALSLLGVLMVYSASAVRTSVTDTSDASGYGYLLQQLKYFAIGMLGLIVALKVDYHVYAKPWVYRFFVTVAVVLLLLVLVPGVGVEVYGARRWIKLPGGSTFQPSEFAKAVLVVLLAATLSANQARIKSFVRGFLPAIGITTAFAVLVLMEDDLGIPVVMMAVALLMIFMAGTRWIYVITSILLAGGAIAFITKATPYRMRRITAFLDPWAVAQTDGFQLIQSLSAFARGSITGQGLGGSEQKLFYLPFPHTDFIFAVLGEEAGLVGTVTVVLLFALFLTVAFRVALCAPDLFGTLLAAGIAAMVSVQAAFNMGVTTGLLPTKGLPLPFISSGGSALIMNLTLIGILINVALQAHEDRAERQYAAARA
ncbi:MAG: putative lipid II flippase FtsW [FCB group bacterium]|jgi:cell division protein FtsW|nr:putative lipid II flippase FtsW [FCB group bacterium]